MVIFKKSPIGEFGLAYFKGDTAKLKPELEKKLIEAGFAERLGKAKKESKPDK